MEDKENIYRQELNNDTTWQTFYILIMMDRIMRKSVGQGENDAR